MIWILLRDEMKNFSDDVAIFKYVKSLLFNKFSTTASAGGDLRGGTTSVTGQINFLMSFFLYQLIF